LLAPQTGNGTAQSRFTVWRSERGFEGEDYLALLDAALDDPRRIKSLLESSKPHMRKLGARIEYVRNMTAEEWT
jgi:hypothetical protein